MTGRRKSTLHSAPGHGLELRSCDGGGKVSFGLWHMRRQVRIVSFGYTRELPRTLAEHGP